MSTLDTLPLPKPLHVDVRHAWMAKAVRWACRRTYHTIDRSGMNPRDLSEKLDDIAMGEIASISVMQFLSDRGRTVVAYDEIRRDGYKQEDPGWDVVVSRSETLAHWAEAPADPRCPPEDFRRLSVKSSRIPKPDRDDIYLAIERRDFKVFKQSARIEDDLTADFETQVYYKLARSRFPSGLATTEGNIRGERVEAIMEDLKLQERYGRCYLTGFCGRQKIIAHSQKLQRQQKSRTWVSRHGGFRKEMWRAPLRLGTSFHRL